MTKEATIEVLEELLASAESLNEEKYMNAFKSAISYINHSEEASMMLSLIEEDYKNEFGADKFVEFACRVAKKAFRLKVEAMEDSAFKDFILENFDTITADTDICQRGNRDDNRASN